MFVLWFYFFLSQTDASVVFLFPFIYVAIAQYCSGGGGGGGEKEGVMEMTSSSKLQWPSPVATL